MPSSRFNTAVLTVDPAKMHEVDTRNAESLHGMWMVFSKCADYMEEGRRLENLSWRFWNRETFCVPPAEGSQFAPVAKRPRNETKDIPELSSSVESAASDDADRIESHISLAPKVDVKPAIVEDDSALSISRGKEKHISSLGLEKMVYNIKERKFLEPLDSLPSPSSSPPATTTTTTPAKPIDTTTPVPTTPAPESAPQDQPPPPVRHHRSSESCSTGDLDNGESDRGPSDGSDTSMSSSGSGLVKSSSIVRGFSPSQISSSYRSHPKLSSTPAPVASQPPPKASPLKKKGGMFTLGGSSGDDESSFEDRMTSKGQRSSLSDSLHQPPQNKKVASFKDIVQSRTIKPIREGSDDDEDAIETDDEEISESAIEDDDDSSDWEDSITESGRSSVDEKELFQRVDSRPNLVSRQSLLTMMMHQPQGGNGIVVTKPGPAGSRSTPTLQQSQFTSPNGSPDDDENTLTMRGPDVPRSRPIVVKNIPTNIPTAHSPRTTRRNMLATELTESLRRHLLWERQQKSTAVVNSGFKRRHTAHDMANLQQYPQPQGQGQGQQQNTETVETPSAERENAARNNNSWNNYFEYGPWEYHVKGW